MKTTGKHRFAALLAVGALAASASACSSGGGDEKEEQGKPQAKTAAVSVGTAADSKGPAAEIPGAKKGGVAGVLNRSGFSHLDPQRAYVSNLMTISELVSRRLTFYKKEGDKTTLVGDLATDPGSTTDGGKTWKFTLKDNLKYEDGSPIVAADVKYGVERSFHKPYNQGPKWVQQWLTGTENYFEAYEGPFNGKELGPDKIEVPDAKTIIFKLTEAHPDFPFAVAMGTSSPMPKAKETKDDNDRKPFASGPYKVTSHEPDKALVLDKNPNWDPATDAIRHQYVDQFKFELGVAAPQQFQRLTAAAGSDAAAFTLNERPDANFAQQIATDPALKNRVTDAVGPYTNRWDINNKRITDVNVRKAMLTAFPRNSARLAEGGPTAGDFANSLASVTQLGFAPYKSLFDGLPPDGDQAKAKQMLEAAGKVGQKVVFCFTTSKTQQERALPIIDSLNKAGFQMERKEISDKEYYDVIGKLDTPCDLYWAGWGADWPTGATVYTPVFDGRKIVDDGENYSQYNNPSVNTEIDRILKITDVNQQAVEWMKLDQKIMEDVPTIPYLYQRHRLVYGPQIGGAGLNIHGAIDLHNVFVK
ncbi:ABC transporter substrate-binding protein [Embleya scabrispora]|uniref:ABC transporter substrate-binding protein n=1 Tax=Embleya scabrispora TaxID=159449 RepID=UPI00039F8300|nr:ABC transporter substrate-binding protein [Embleya scabrispora]MYS83375.1 ABC transporter substrate-binding protein [Streptomyces sp. SID5474]